VTTAEVTFGNLWHGKLGAGTIELVPGSPVNSITLDGVTKSVQTVDGNMGFTRYCKAPGLPSPVTPADVTAVHGEFKNDFILYSSKFRYSPLSPQSVLPNAFQWLLYDGTAKRWRKMSAGITVVPLASNAAAGSNCLQINVDRGPLFGTINHVQGDTAPAIPGTTFVGSRNLLLNYAYSPLHRPTSYFFDPSFRQASIEPSPDGRKILIRMEALRLNGYLVPPEAGLGSGFTVYDASQSWIFAVWEITFNSDGTTMSAPVEVWPDRPLAEIVLWAESKWTQTGSVYWTETPVASDPTWKLVQYYLPLMVYGASNVTYQYDTSIILNAAYDKDGTIELTHLRMYSDNSQQIVSNYHGVPLAPITGTYGVGVPMLATEDPADHIPSFSFDSAFHRYEPYVVGTVPEPVLYSQHGTGANSTVPLNGDVDVVTTPTYICHIEIAKGTTVLKSWSAPFAGPISWRWVTNNVIELYTGTTSIARVGPGVVDDTPIAQGAYASWNPRTNQLLSSTNPIGWV